MTEKYVKAILKIFAVALLAFVMILMFALFYFGTSSGQKFLSDKVIGVLSSTLKTPVSGQISYSVPDWVKVDQLLIKDQQSDTLLFAGSCKIDLDMMALINKEIKINKVVLDRAYLNVYDKKGQFNYEPILKALAGDTSKPKTKNSKPFGTELHDIFISNLKLRYKDNLAGHDFNSFIKSAKTSFELFDMDKAKYFLKNIVVDGLALNGQIGNSVTKKNQEKSKTNFNFAALDLQNVDLNLLIKSSQKVIQSSNLKLRLEPKSIDLPNSKFIFERLVASASILNYKSKSEKKSLAGEMDLTNLALKNTQLSLNDISIANDTVLFKLKNLKTEDRSGLQLNEGHLAFMMNPKEMIVNDLVFKTNRSEFKAGIKLNRFTDANSYVVNLISSKIGIADALFFSSGLSKNAYFKKLHKDIINLNGQIAGNDKMLSFSKLNLMAPSRTKLLVAGKITNFKKPNFDIQISQLNTTKNDLVRVLDKNQLPQNINLPENIALSGKVFGQADNLNVKLVLKSEQGLANMALNLITTQKTPDYKGNIALNNYQLGKMLKNPSLGLISTNMAFKGQGFDFKTLKTQINGTVNSVMYDGKSYQNVKVNGLLAKQLFDTQISIDDPKAKVTWNGQIDLKSPTLQISGNTKVDKLNLKAMGLSNDNIQLSGDLDLRQFKMQGKNPLVELYGQNVVLTKDNVAYKIGMLNLKTENNQNKNFIYLTTKFLNLAADGNIELAQLSDVILTEVNNYFKIPDYKPSKILENYQFNVSGTVSYDPIFKVFQPSLLDFQTIKFKALVQNKGLVPLSGNISIPYLLYDSLKVYNSNFDFVGDNQILQYNILSEKVFNTTFRLRNAAIVGTVKDNIAGFNLSVKDSLNKPIHALSGTVQSVENKFRLSFDESGSLLFYEPWAGNPYGYVDYSKAGVYFNNLVFTSGKQIVRVNSETEISNGPLKIFTENINLNKMAKAFLQDSTLVSGTLDTDIELKNYMAGALTYIGDFTVNDLILKQVALGKLQGKAETAENNAIKLTSTLVGENSDMNIAGSYNPSLTESLDFDVNISKLDNRLIQAYASEIIKDISGQFIGNFKVKGSPQNPDVVGNGNFNNFKFLLIETGGTMVLNDQKIYVKDKQLLFKDFQVKDSEKNQLILNGFVNINNLPNYNYNFQINTKDFKLIDAKKGDNEMFIGTGFFDADLNLVGKNLDFKLTGDVKIDPKTDLTMLMPDDASQSGEMFSMIDFRSFDKPNLLINKPRIKTSSINFANAVNIGVEVTDEATLKILMDPVSGDMMTVNGNGKLNAGFNNTGDLFIIGKYNITKGKYNLTYQVVKRQFIITQTSNSYISWTGKPTAADLNITAEYKAGRQVLGKFPIQSSSGAVTYNTALDQFNVPVRIDLIVNGFLTSPNIGFSLVLNKSDVSSQASYLQQIGFKLLDNYGKKIDDNLALDQLTEENIKTQSIFLLVANNFNSLGTQGGGADFSKGAITGNMEQMARSTASDLITNQLNKYTQGLVKGLDLNMGVQSGVNTNTDSRNTNLNVGVSKRFANDRLILKVGKNFELENKDLKSDEIFDNIEANGLLTKDGRYRVNAFRKTSSLSSVEGTLIQTGLGFAIALDYDVWSDLKKKKK